MKKFIAFIGILILIVPGVLCAYFYGKAVEEERAREKLVSVAVLAPDGREYVYSVDSADKLHKDAVSLFRSFALLSEKSEKTGEELSGGGKTFEIKYVTTHAERAARAYVLKKDTGYLAYFDGGAGIYCIDDSARASFLSSEFALCVYDVSEIPLMKVSGEDVIASSAEWKIKMVSGAYSAIDTSMLVPSQKNVKDYSGASSISFTLEPDHYTVKVKDEVGDILFDGDSYTFPELVIDRSKQIYVDVNATWYQSPDKGYYGSASYSFSAYVVAKPEFYLSAHEAQPGSAVLLSCLNIPFDSEVSADFSPSLCNVTLYRDGMNLYTFIPVSYNAKPGSYNLKITVDKETHTLPLTVSEKTFPVSSAFQSSLISADKVEACLNDEAVAEYNALLSAVAATDSTSLYYDGSLKDYQKLLSLYKGFGFHLRYTGSERTSRNDGVYFTAKAGSVLTSMGDGVVCAVGECAYLGKYIVVDHGYGLRSWYVTLGETSLQLGAEVKTGDAVGKSGNTGIALKGKTLVMITVADTPVSPYPFWESNTDFVR